jgi:tRNA dimethylallyltransferase
MRAVGYRQLWAHLDGEFLLDEAIRRGIFATRQLAKRQLTWMRAEARFARVDAQQPHARSSWIREAQRALRELGL